MGEIGAYKEGLSVWEKAGRQVVYVVLKKWFGWQFGDSGCRVIRKGCF